MHDVQYIRLASVLHLRSRSTFRARLLLSWLYLVYLLHALTH